MVVERASKLCYAGQMGQSTRGFLLVLFACLLNNDAAQLALEPGNRDTGQFVQKEVVYTNYLASSALHGNPERLHFLISSECNLFMIWQVEVFAHHMFRYMPGVPLTVLVSNKCPPGVDLKQIHARWPRLKVYFTPDARAGPDGTDDWRFYNKGFSIKYWLDREPIGEEIIVLVDADMIIFRPFHLATMQAEFGWKSIPQKGKPAAASFAFFPIEWARLNACRNLTNCKVLFDTIISGEEGANWVAQRYTPGPPFIMHKDDLADVAVSWYQLAHDVREDKKKLKSPLGNNDEMFGFSISAANLTLEFMQSDRISFSSPVGVNRFAEDWDALEAGNITMYCLHYCQYYAGSRKNQLLKLPSKQTRLRKAMVGSQYASLTLFVKYDWGYAEQNDVIKEPFHLVEFFDCPGVRIDPSTGVLNAKVGLAEHLVRPHITENAYGLGSILDWNGHKEKYNETWQNMFMANMIIANINAAVVAWQDFFCPVLGQGFRVQQQYPARTNIPYVDYSGN